METNYTKGPWTLTPAKGNDNSGAIFVCGRSIVVWHGKAEHLGCEKDFTKEEAEANAQLIAAAPEMLEALQFIVQVASGKQDDKSKTIELRFERDALLTWLSHAKSAVTKATGK